jgi:DNA polymerase-3 subunit delta
MSFKKFNEDIKKGLPSPLIFLYGEEDFLIRWALGEIIQKYIPAENREFDVKELPGNAISVTDILINANTPSMFSDRRVIVVRDYEPLIRKGAGKEDISQYEPLLELSEQTGSGAVVVFTLGAAHSGSFSAFGKKLAGTLGAYNFKRLDKDQLAGFISKRIKSAGKYAGRRELQLIIDQTGYLNRESDYTLSELENDLKKLVNAVDGTDIDAAAIEDVMTGDDEKFIFDLVDALVSGRNDRAMTMAMNIMTSQGGDSLQIIGMLIKQFEIMYDSLELAGSGMSIKEAASTIKTHEFRFKKAYAAARRFGKGTIKKLLTELYDIDKEMKAGNMDKDIALELFISKV